MGDDRNDIAELLAQRDDELALHRAQQDGGGPLLALRRYRDRFEKAEATIARVDALHQPERSIWYQPCPDHAEHRERHIMDACPTCRKTPDVACASFYCSGWPCHVHVALHDETEDTCTHAGEPGEAREDGSHVPD